MVVDDASTDGSLEIARSYGEKIQLIRNERNLGQPLATTRAVEAAHGEYAAILHSDDCLLPDFVSTLAPLLSSYTSAGLAVGERLELEDDGEPQKIPPFYERDCLIPGERQAKVFLFSGFLPCQVLVRKRVFDQAGGVDPRHIVNLDGLLWFRCSLLADVVYTQKPVGIYRRHAMSTTAAYNRSIEHLLEYYGTLREMFRLARGRPALEKHFQAATRRLGALAVRYCRDVLLNGNGELSSRYLDFATALDPALRQDLVLRAYRFCAEAPAPREMLEAVERVLPATKRAHSWECPPGATPLTCAGGR